MSVVRCPSCNRALNLPESAGIATAQCPLCQHTFDITASVIAVPASPLARPVRETDVRSPLHFGDEKTDSAEDRQAVNSAGLWMKGASIAGFVHLFFCGCVSITYIGDRETLVYTYCGSYLFQLLASAVVYTGANSLQQRTSIGWVRWAGFVALFMSGLSLLLAMPLVRAMSWRPGPSSDDTFFLTVILVLNGSVIVSFLIAGSKALLVLGRPGVRREFRR